ncbi:hypothetical protein A2160_01530 [Candidatus Beckwithbacteria bacterium RBG_13_42_9]|uniref:GIY-YIG domain-containing protein n=1 Tax=Candidatus Beckwithbacteria bacterium RBG_13_42_9 TaxID=1797457 RepID=A0A1F5E9I0_9BACT|nr:MAG: hypothetical protein A2160_01530 [Candidatus Beckwithbacteria bacterium RBG_13_42_9]
MYSVYAIKSTTTEKIYIGFTSNLDIRLRSHNQEFKTKRNSYTRLNAGPWILIYHEDCLTKREAQAREKQLKSYKGREFVKSKIK